MDDAAAMGDVQRIRDLDPAAQHLSERQRSLLQPVSERLSLEQFHHQVVDAVLVTDVVERADVRVVETRDRARLVLESRAYLRARREAGR